MGMRTEVNENANERKPISFTSTVSYGDTDEPQITRNHMEERPYVNDDGEASTTHVMYVRGVGEFASDNPYVMAEFFETLANICRQHAPKSDDTLTADDMIVIRTALRMQINSIQARIDSREKLGVDFMTAPYDNARMEELISVYHKLVNNMARAWHVQPF